MSKQPSIHPSDQPRVYVAGKLSAHSFDYLANVRSMMILAERVRKEGFAVFVPCWDTFAGIMFEWRYDDAFGNSQPWLCASDAMLCAANWEDSPGTVREIALAEELEIPVFYSIHDLKAWRDKEWKGRE